MNKNNIYTLEFTFNLQFSYKTTSMYGRYFNNGTTTFIHRNAFALESVNFSNNYNYSGTDNYFYNSVNDKKISVTANIKTTGSSRDYGYNALKGATVYFDRAYLKAGDNVTLDATDSSGKKSLRQSRLKTENHSLLNFRIPRVSTRRMPGLCLCLTTRV
ncbi:MAG: hypothetical protein L6V93_22980 [Clostridiales bacterium]|nr:MAG: hypothetical protein L6V93_22980 [Clostridiales bacterium]